MGDYLCVIRSNYFIYKHYNRELFHTDKGLVKVIIKGDAVEIIKVRLRVLIFNFDFYPLRKIKFSAKSNGTKKTVKKKRSTLVYFILILRILWTFKIKQFRAEIDSGDCIFKTKLFTFFTLLNYLKGTNFESRNSVLLSSENRPIRIIKSILTIK